MTRGGYNIHNGVRKLKHYEANEFTVNDENSRIMRKRPRIILYHTIIRNGNEKVHKLRMRTVNREVKTDGL